MKSTDVCAPVANFGMSLFKKVAITVGNTTTVTSSSDHYPYLAYLHNVVQSSQFHKDKFDYISMIYRDVANGFDVVGQLNPGIIVL